MRVLWYLLTAFFGLMGVLSALRTIELLVTGGELPTTQLGIALVGLVLAVLFLRKARAAS